MADDKPAKKKPRRPAGTAPRVEIADGIAVPAGAERYRIMRCDPQHPHHPRRPCSAHVGGMRQDLFSVAAGFPSIDLVKRTWGSATYRFAWFRAEGKPAGVSPCFTIDDPEFPMRPEYTPPSAPAAQPAPAPPPPSTGPNVIEALASVAKDGKVELGMVMVLLQMVAAQGQTSEDRYRRWMAEEADRRRQQEDDHMRRLQQQQVWADQQAQALAAFWRGQTEAARELARNPSDDREDRLADAIDAMNERIEQVAAQPAGNEEAWERMIEKFAPLVMARFMQQPAAPAPPAIPNGQGGQ